MIINAKAILFVALVLSAHVSARDIPQTKDDGNNIDIVINVALEILSGALKIVSGVVDTYLTFAANSLESLAADAEQIEQNLVQDVEDLVDKVTVNINNEIEKLKNSTSEAGVDIADCVESSNSSIVTSVDKAISTAAGCVKGLLQTVVEDIEVVIDDLKETNDEIKPYADDVLSCKESDDAAKCVEDILQKIADKVVAVGDDVKNEIAKINDALDKFSKTAETCIKPNKKILEKELEKVYEDFATCVQEKLKN